MSTRRLSSLERAAADAGRARDAQVDAAERKTHGVVHTPPELARYVIECADEALVGAGFAAGLADPRVTVVDPACGPGAFLAATCARIEGRATRPAALVGMDRDPAALAQARALLPADVRLVRGDTLESLALADEVDVVVVVGNPPWAGRSESRTDLLDTLLEDFRRDAQGEPLRERKIGVLSDAYVRFVRWGAELVRRAPGGGVLGFVTNASYLDGPVHRGMRAALARWFHTLKVLDLGGSALIARRSGERDDNVFGVRPSVSVLIAAKGAGEAPASEVQIATPKGTRDEKLASLGDAPFEVVAPSAVWKASRGGASSWPDAFVALDVLFPFHREGVQTNRDAVVIDRDRDVLLARLHAFGLALDDPRLGAGVGARDHFDPERARRAVVEALRVDPEGTTWLRPIAYRPFDRRWLAALPALCHRPRPDLAEAVARSELSLVTVRKDRGTRAWNHVAIVDAIVDNCFLSSRSSCRTRAFPTHAPDGSPNLSELGHAWAGEGGARALALHAVTWLCGEAYRTRFEALLAADYPRIPPPTPRSIELGEALAAAFLGPSGEVAAEVGHVGVSVTDAYREARAEADAYVRVQLASLG
ncbi:MAG: N-6 DNA methylase [Sandaracinus sp.]|nr:N-6 DNA methylase [Sandaracinus sp.]